MRARIRLDREEPADTIVFQEKVVDLFHQSKDIFKYVSVVVAFCEPKFARQREREVNCLHALEKLRISPEYQTQITQMQGSVDVSRDCCMMMWMIACYVTAATSCTGIWGF